MITDKPKLAEANRSEIYKIFEGTVLARKPKVHS